MFSAFIHNPFGSRRLGDFLLENLATPQWTQFRAAVAFAKRSGTSYLCPPLSKSKAEVKLSVGINHGGTSIEALTELYRCISPSGGRLFIVNNGDSYTFHPKIFLFRSANAAKILIGSGNLTRGGLYTNYEGAFELTLDCSVADDVALLTTIESVLDSWCDVSSPIVKAVDEKLLDVLTSYVPTEAAITKSAGAMKSALSPKATEAKIFGHIGIPSAPKLVGVTAELDKSAVPESGGADNVAMAAEEEPAPPQYSGPMRFVMTLQNTDAGVGMKTKGASKRSPEIFIPVSRKFFVPDFWNFTTWKPDPKFPGKLDKAVRVSFGKSILDATIWYNPDKIDIRLRNSQLRAAAKIGSIIVLERAPTGAGYDYQAEIVHPADKRFGSLLKRCIHRGAGTSKKRYGYC